VNYWGVWPHGLGENMCQATVYLGKEMVAKDVTWLQPVEKGVEIKSFFDPPQVIEGRIVGIDFLKHRVLLVPVQEKGE